MNIPAPIGLLDEIRRRHGSQQLILFFHNHLKNDMDYAIKLINDDNLQFASLFILKDMLKDHAYINILNLRNRIALDLVFEILTGEKDIWPFDSFSCKQISKVNEVLHWILSSALTDDGLSKDFDEVIDKVCLLLSKVYRDKSILASLVDLIFKRNERNSYYGDLTWAFFEYGDARSLMIIASKLMSEKEKDKELARRLLCFVPGMNSDILNSSYQNYYYYFLSWFQENNMFLGYTRESFHHSKYPKHYAINSEAKYLCRIVANETGNILGTLTEEEEFLLNAFNKLDEDAKTLLCSFSFALNNQSLSLWKHWLQFSIEDQISIASIGGVR